MSSRQVIRQRDFTGGEIVEHAKRRDDEPIVRSGARGLRNARILSSGAVEQRPGRSALFAEMRSDEVRMSATYSAYLCFGEGMLTIRDSTGAAVARAWGYDWAEDTVGQAVWAPFDNDIIITFPGQVPKIARWDGGTAWTFLDFAFDVSGNVKHCPFYRIAPKGIGMTPSATTGSITITFDDDYLVSGMIGNRLNFVGTEMTITAVSTPRSGTATVHGTVSSNQQTLTFSSFLTTPVAGDVVFTVATGAQGVVTSVSSPAFTVELTGTARFAAGVEVFKTPLLFIGAPTTVVDASLSGSVEWTEEVMNAYRGWPRSVTSDQRRLIFCDLPGVPDGISWSVVGLATDHRVGANADDGMFETVPKKARVYHVMEGADEFVITDRGIYYVPISESNPLRPGSVAFRRVPGPSGSAVRPVTTGQGVAYVNNGLNRVLAITPTGQTAMPWLVRAVSDLHSHLFAGVTCLAFEEGDGDPPDELLYAVNADGTVAVGRYQPGKEWVGWTPWDGEGAVGWASALGDAVIFNTEYDAGWLAEQVDPDRYLDAATDYDAIPTGLSNQLVLPPLALADDQGTAIGTMTAGGGLAAAFDGTTSQGALASATKTSSTTGAVGKTFGQPFRIFKVAVWPSSDLGFTDQATVTVTIRAKNGTAPADYAADGTQIATTGSIADTTTVQVLLSTDTVTEWDHGWALLTIASGATYAAEVRFFSPGLDPAQAGKLWFLRSDTLYALDGRRIVGTRVIDSNGDVTLQEGDAFTDETFGHGFTLEAEPFTPHMQGGQSFGQTMHKRQISDIAVAVQNSTGFKVQKWNPNTRDWGDLKERAAYLAGEDEGAEPPLREEVWQPGNVGAEHDPRVRVVKDAPGPLRVLEIGFEIGA